MEVMVTIVSKLVYVTYLGNMQPAYTGVIGHPFTKYQQDIPVQFLLGQFPFFFVRRLVDSKRLI